MFTPSRTPSSSSSRRRAGSSFSGTPRRSALSALKPSLSRRSYLHTSRSGLDSTVSSPGCAPVFTSENCSVESAGTPLPVLVSEVISAGGDSSGISIEINENGWAWMVCHRKLYVWRVRSKAALCKEFSLPSLGHSESCHQANLIFVGKKSTVTMDEGHISLLVVCPQGSVKFWPNTTQSMTSFVDSTLEGIGSVADDEECIKLVPLNRGFLIATSKGALYHIVPTTNSVSCSRLQVSHGMLAGIGRRVSSFFFASAQTINLLTFVALHTMKRSPPDVILMTTSSLQKWHLGSISGSGTDHMVSQTNMNSLLDAALSQAMGISPGNLHIWPLDLALSSNHNHTVLLTAVEDSTESGGIHRKIRYALCILPPSVFEDNQCNDSFVEIVMMEHTEVAMAENLLESEALSYKIIVPDSSATVPEQVIMWRSNNFVVKSIMKGGKHEEAAIPFSSSGDEVMGIGRMDSRCMLLSQNNGLLVVSMSSKHSLISKNIEDSIMLTSSSRLETPTSSVPSTPIVSKVKIEKLESSESGTQRLQAAFIHFNRMNIAQAKNVIQQAFLSEGTGANLDESAISVSGELIDDYPAQDPRWAESVPQDSGNSSNSLIIHHQLQDKQKAHDLYLNFLSEIGLWEQLSHVTVSGSKMYTHWSLIEHGEKLCAAIALRQRHAHHQDIVDIAVRRVLEQRNRILDNRSLTPQDVFYREVSKVHDILGCLVDVEEETIGSSLSSPQEIFTTIAGINEIMEGMLSSACQYRKFKGVPSQSQNSFEFRPWTMSTGRYGIQDLVLRQHKITLSHGLSEAEDGQQRAALHSHLVSLTDILLDGYKQQLDSLSDSSKSSARRDEVYASYKKNRTQLISPILEIGLLDKAASLAEKYHDFEILVRLCDRKDSQDRLSRYMTKFSNQGFSDYLFNWYLEGGKIRKLLDCSSINSLSGGEYSEKLMDFLQAHPKIAWMHHIKTGDYMAAHYTLQYLASIETQSAAKKTNFLSLSKLSAVFSDENEDAIEQKVDSISSQQTVLHYQETLPSMILEKIGTNVDTMPVMPVQKLIEMYISEDNECSNEVDFKKALDLLQFLPQEPEDGSEEMDDDLSSDLPDAEVLKLSIWCRAILKDSWDDIDHRSNPLEACNHTILFKTFNLTNEAGMLRECLPDVERLLEQEELGSLRESASSQYLIRAGFEHVHRTLEAEC